MYAIRSYYVQGLYGERIVEHIRKSAPQEWSIQSIPVPEGLPAVVDDPEDFLPVITSYSIHYTKLYEYGVTRHNVLGLEAVLPNGAIIRTGGKFV